MAPEGWRYYLPAYLLMALEGDEADVVADAVVFNLTHPRARVDAYSRTANDLGLAPEQVLAEQTARFAARFGDLTAEEVDAARAVLEWLAAEEDGRNASFAVELPNSAREAVDSWRLLSSA